jgi:hypothetical protein
MVNPCYLGVDTARRDELIAANMSVAEICQHIGADSLGYLSIEGLRQSIGLPERSNCFACFNGDYPVPVQLEMSKLNLEARRRRVAEAIDVVGEREQEEAAALALARLGIKGQGLKSNGGAPLWRASTVTHAAACYRFAGAHFMIPQPPPG